MIKATWRMETPTVRSGDGAASRERERPPAGWGDVSQVESGVAGSDQKPAQLESRSPRNGVKAPLDGRSVTAMVPG